MAIPKALQATIEAFLAGGKRQAEGGGWPAVQPEEIDQLHELLEQLLDCKYERDADGSLPVDVILTDRTRFYPHLTLDIPYAHKPFQNMTPVEVRMLAADRYSALAKHASEQAGQHMSALRMELQRTTEQQRPMKWGGVDYAPVLPAGVTVASLQLALDTTVRTKQEQEPCPTDYVQKLAWADAVAKEVGKAHGVPVLFGAGLATTKHVQLRFDVPALGPNTSIRVDTAKPPATAATDTP